MMASLGGLGAGTGAFVGQRYFDSPYIGAAVGGLIGARQGTLTASPILHAKLRGISEWQS